MRQWFGIAVGGLNWSPGTFWKSTVAEFFMAIDGHNDVHRIGPKPMTRAELNDLVAANPPSRSIKNAAARPDQHQK